MCLPRFMAPLPVELWHLFSGAQQLGFFQLRQITEKQQTWKGNVEFLGLELFPETSKDDDDDDDDDVVVVVDDTDTVGQCQEPHGLVWMIDCEQTSATTIFRGHIILAECTFFLLKW